MNKESTLEKTIEKGFKKLYDKKNRKQEAAFTNGVKYANLQMWDLLKKYEKEIERLNKGLEYIELYWSNREEYEKNELLKQIRDKDTSTEWLEKAIEEEKKRERLH